jgi:hypothetical protein
MTLKKPHFVFPFSPHMPAFVTDYDVAMAYEFFLGRTPESAAVIADHKQRRFDDLVTRFIHSEEFIESTARPMLRGAAVARLDHTRAPNRSQTSWLIKNFIMDEAAQQALYSAQSWDKFFRVLLNVDPVDADGVAEPEPTIEYIPPEPEPPPFADLPPVPAFMPLSNAENSGRSGEIQEKLAQIEGLIGEIRALLAEDSA